MLYKSINCLGKPYNFLFTLLLYFLSIFPIHPFHSFRFSFYIFSGFLVIFILSMNNKNIYITFCSILLVLNLRIYSDQICLMDLNKYCVKISRPYILYFLRNKPSKRVTVGPDRVGPVHQFKLFSLY